MKTARINTMARTVTIDTYDEQMVLSNVTNIEMEIVGRNAKAFHMTEHLLKKDGVVITTGDRRFWDMTDPWVIEYLSNKVIKLLKECGFGYLKVDYNDNIGIGCDGAESLGEGLRTRVLGSQAFFRKIKAEIPDLVIENCSSGGHRLEPS
ncbi:MAG: alpha-galactosidase, partial [Oscillospiraceae bacterium]